MDQRQGDVESLNPPEEHRPCPCETDPNVVQMFGEPDLSVLPTCRDGAMEKRERESKYLDCVTGRQ